MKNLSMEIKVGLLILAALVIMGGFLFVLGGVRLSSGYTVYVDFNNPGGLKTGAPVRVAGVRMGTVEATEYLGGSLDPKTGRRSLVRIKLQIDTDVQKTIHEDAIFYVTSQGVLGEPYVAIDPGSPDRPTLAEGTVVHGVDPPRLDLALAMGYELLETMVTTLRDNREELQGMLTNAASMLRSMNELLTENHDRVNNIIANVDTATQDGAALVAAIRETYGDGTQAKRIFNNLDKVLDTTSKEAGPLMHDVRGAVADARDLLGEEQRTALKSAIRDTAQLTDKAKVMLNDSSEILARVKRGEGTAGALLTDEAVYDDLQEMLRDLKHNPWKLFWRE